MRAKLKCYNKNVLDKLKIFTKKTQNQNVLVFDVSSSAVSGALFRSSAQGEPSILRMARSKPVILEKVKLNGLWFKLREEFKNLSRNIISGADEKPDKVFVIFSSPWYFSQIRALKVLKKEPFIVNSRLLEELIKDEVEIFKRRSLEKFSLPEANIDIMEHEIMKVQLNGYDVKNYENKEVNDLKLFVYLSTIMKQARDEVASFFSSEYGLQEINFHTPPHVLHLALSEIFNAKEGFLTLDIGGEITEISIIKEGLIKEIASFAFGKNAIIRSIAESFKVEFSQAYSLFKIYNAKDIAPQTKQKLEVIFKQSVNEWRRVFEKTLVNIAVDLPMPVNAFLIGGGAALPQFRQAVSDESLSHFTFLKKPFAVQTILPRAFQERIMGDVFYRGPDATFLILSVLFANNILGE